MSDRMYMRCKECADLPNGMLYLGKTFGTGYSTETDPAEYGNSVQAFFEAHDACAINNPNCFEIVYETGEPNIAPTPTDRVCPKCLSRNSVLADSGNAPEMPQGGTKIVTHKCQDCGAKFLQIVDNWQVISITDETRIHSADELLHNRA